jgi:hypothetical protein
VPFVKHLWVIGPDVTRRKVPPSRSRRRSIRGQSSCGFVGLGGSRFALARAKDGTEERTLIK